MIKSQASRELYRYKGRGLACDGTCPEAPGEHD